ncbi:MAG: hypothetical protein WA999_02410 [Spirulinaceae cyanobacterium]
MKQSKTDKNLWYLGIDFGTTRLTAMLFNSASGKQYPLYWSFLNKQGAWESSFRLPAVAYYGPEVKETKKKDDEAFSPFVVGTAAYNFQQHSGIFLENFKAFFHLAVPYYRTEGGQWEPKLRGFGSRLVSLHLVQIALQTLLQTLVPASEEKEELAQSSSILGAVGCEQDTLKGALQDLEGVIVSRPGGWGDTYGFNLRESILKANLVARPEQIFFLEEAIAVLLANLQGQEEEEAPQGATLVIQAGATTTELLLGNIPEDLANLTRQDLALYSFNFGGDSLDQDIFCQLLYPYWSQQQPTFKLETDSFPVVAQVEAERRSQLDLTLKSSPVGQSLLEAAKLAKFILQYRPELTSPIGDLRWHLKKEDLETKVIQPYVQQINQYLNQLLSTTGISDQLVERVICSGGTTVTIWPVLAQWLKQKLPNAQIIQDTGENSLTRVASGLTHLVRFPQLVKRLQHQYSDYFLLRELLGIFPQEPQSLTTIFNSLERRGINTDACYQRLLALMKGELPRGLIPLTSEYSWLSLPPNSEFNLEPLFMVQEDGLYAPNQEQYLKLKQHLQAILLATEQKLEDPLSFDL